MFIGFLIPLCRLFTLKDFSVLFKITANLLKKYESIQEEQTYPRKSNNLYIIIRKAEIYFMNVWAVKSCLEKYTTSEYLSVISGLSILRV